MNKERIRNEYQLGVILVVLCQVVWGFLPIFWQTIKPVDSWIIIMYRIATMFVYALILALARHSWKELLEPLKNRKIRIKYFTAGLILTVNWSTYIWAINSGRVIQAAIGYFIEPIVICLFGIIIFHEKITKYNATAIGFAVVAVLLILFHFGQLPGTALVLALTWATYSAIKKTADLPITYTLLYETMIYGIISVVAIIVMESKGVGALAYNMPAKMPLLILTGLVTIIPIGLFGAAAKKVTLLTIGLAQYISPTITLACGIFLFKEPIDIYQVIAFGIIWIGLIFFTTGEIKNSK